MAWRHFSSLQNILAKNRQKWIFLKMLQMGWNFYTNSKIRQKTKKSAQKIDMTSLWRHFGQFLQKKLRSFFFTADLAKNFEKIDVTLNFFSIFELQIFFHKFWEKISTIWPFLSNLCHFLCLTCFVLEVPENRWFL